MDQVLINEIENSAKHKNLTLVLFGSYSRGDYDSSSDIDVLEITREKEKPYSKAKINFSTYSLDQLKTMASEGNLFVLHIIMEGEVISGNFKILDILNASFKRQNNYKGFRDEIILTAKLLDVSEKNFKANSKGYYGLLCYLFRSYLYAMTYDESLIEFSIKKIAAKYNDQDISKVFNLKYNTRITYSEYLNCKSIFQKYAKSEFTNHLIDRVELLRSLQKSSKFGFNIALHFLEDLVQEIYI